jgi:hypothetical protein
MCDSIDLHVGDRSMRPIAGLIAVPFIAFVLLAAVVWWIGARNPVTPAGYVGYLTKARSWASRGSSVHNAASLHRGARGCST